MVASASPCVLPLYPGFLAFLALRTDGRPLGRGRFLLGVFVLAGVLTMMLLLGLTLAALSLSIGRALSIVIPHQANLRITQAVGAAMELPEGKVFSNIERYGNTTAASIPIALDECLELGRIREGDLLCLAAFGSGFTWASALLRW